MSTKALASVVTGFAVFAAASAVARPAQANGFLLYEASATGVAQGGAMIADASEASAVFYNPAGMVHLSKVELQATFTGYYAGAATFKGPSGVTEKSDAGFFPVPSLFATWRPTDWLAVGIGTYSAYGLGIGWQDKWSGYSLVKKATLQSYTVQPSIAVGPFAGFSIGAGVDLLAGSVDIERGIPFTDGEYGRVRIGGAANGIGFNAGVLYQPADWVKLGLTFRSAIKLGLNTGRADFTVPAAFQENLRDQGVTTSLTTPPLVGFGARFKPLPKLQAELDVVYVGWSTYDELDFRFETPALNSPQPKNWRNVYQLRGGGQYELGDGRIRAGFIFDKNPVPDQTLDPLLPDSDRVDFALGGGYRIGKIQLDAAYMFVYFLPRTVGTENAFPGTYNVTAHVFSLGASLRL